MEDQRLVPARADDRREAPRLYSLAARGVRIRDIRTRRLARRFVKACGWLIAADQPMVRAFAQLEILAEEAYAKIVADGIVNADGAPHRLLLEYRSLRRVQADIAGRLGLSPRDRTQMKSASTAAALEGIDVARIDRILKRAKADDAALQEVMKSDQESTDGNDPPKTA
ncbi:MAG: hypothetical protein ACLQDV_07030 [Candidatus Binataceae bacterium]